VLTLPSIKKAESRVEDLQSWSRFQALTQERCSTSECMLQLDIKGSFSQHRAAEIV